MNIVAIRATAESIVSAELGPEFSELPFQFEMENNDSRSLDNGYSVVWGSGSQSNHIDSLVGIEQDLTVHITKRVFTRNDDNQTTDTVDSVYGPIGNIIKRFVMNKLDIENTVQWIGLTSLGEPQRIGKGRDLVMVTLQFRVRYLIN